MLPKSEEYYENLEEGSELPMKLFEENESLESNVEVSYKITVKNSGYFHVK